MLNFPYEIQIAKANATLVHLSFKFVSLKTTYLIDMVFGIKNKKERDASTASLEGLLVMGNSKSFALNNIKLKKESCLNLLI